MKNHGQIFRILMAVTIAFVITLLPTLKVYAADPYLNCGCQYGSISVKSYSNSYNSTWVSILDSGRSAWTSSSANVSISTSSSSVNRLEAGRYDDTWYGINESSYNPSTGYITSFTIKINARTISNDATNFSNFAKSTVVHEFGHSFWLCDNPSTSSSSIMKYSRDRNSMTTPQTFDINNVNAKY